MKSKKSEAEPEDKEDDINVVKKSYSDPVTIVLWYLLPNRSKTVFVFALALKVNESGEWRTDFPAIMFTHSIPTFGPC